MNRDAWEVFVNDVSIGIFFDFEFVTYIISHIINSNRDGRIHLTIAKCGMELIHNEHDENNNDSKEKVIDPLDQNEIRKKLNMKKEKSISAETYPDDSESFKEDQNE